MSRINLPFCKTSGNRRLNPMLRRVGGETMGMVLELGGSPCLRDLGKGSGRAGVMTRASEAKRAMTSGGMYTVAEGMMGLK
jgi:hypothetical protein